MKRSERHHLKENALALSFARSQEWLLRNQRTVVVGVAVIAVTAALVGAYFVWQRQVQSRAGALLAEALVVAQAPVIPPPPPPITTAADTTAEDAEPEADAETPEAETPDAEPDSAASEDTAAEPAPAPEEFTQPPGSFPSEQARIEAALPKLLAAADAYPTTGPGITARYHAATVLVAAGRTDEADAQYQQVIESAGNGFYGQMAKLGLADAQLQAGDYESAISLLEEVTAPVDGDLPTDAIFMRLGQAYQLAGREAEATSTFTRVVDEFPGSMYATDANQELERMKQFGGGGPS